VAAPTSRIKGAAAARLKDGSAARAMGVWALAGLALVCLHAAAPGVAQAMALPAPSGDGTWAVCVLMVGG
jgi:hypothetical protein